MASIPVPGELQSRDELGWQIVGFVERAGAAVLLVILSPVLAAAAIAVAVLSGRTPLIAHRRVGWRGEVLWMLKLRTMWGCGGAGPKAGWVEYIADETGPELKRDGDPRVTSRFARFCRRHSIDELPQLWHVIAGQMALVGPRPITPAEFREHYGAEAAGVLEVKPGIAGLWQVSGRNRLSYAERRMLDLEFVERRTAWLYLRILLKTVPAVLTGSNSC